ncbi:MAG TPA: anthrone oxygenase family protein [Gammaproteobacteria bacterium]|nr:anthrone oxygenase family protein [Gammaproteobacteria bacterium]
MFSVDQVFFAVTFIAALGCGLVAGIFFAFSAFVMKALSRLPADQGIAAMQSINVAVLNPWFMTAFFGTAALCLAALVVSVNRWPDAAAICLITGSALYLIGTLAVTIVCNVPRNNSLAAVSATDPKSGDTWAGYVAEWTAWNHVRTIASLAAAASFSIALAL